MSATAQPVRRRRSLIPWLFPAAMAPVMAANGALIYYALHSMPPLVADRPFEDGRTYNRELAAAAAQTALGWTASLAAPTKAAAESRIEFAVRDRSGAPVSGLAVAVRVWRPVGDEPDLRLRLVEQRPGDYAAVVTLPLAGQWQFDLVARRGAEEFAIGRRVVVQ
jgi:nitrogen fixation protein FixH